MPQEDDVRECDQNYLFDECRTQRIDSVPNERTAVVERHNANAFRQAWLHRSNLVLDRIDDIECVCTVADDHNAADRVFTPPVEHSAPKIRPQLDGSHITHIHRCTVHGSQSNVFDVSCRTDQAQPANDVLHIVGFDDLGADVAVTPLNGFKDRADRNVVSPELRRIDVDLI